MEVLWKKNVLCCVAKHEVTGEMLHVSEKNPKQISNFERHLSSPKMGRPVSNYQTVKFKLGETLLQSSQKSREQKDHDLVMVLICLYPHTRKANSQKMCVFISSTKKRLEVVS